MKKDYIIPTIFLINYEEESKLLSHSLQGDAHSVSAASDVDHDAMSGKSPLPTDNSGNVSEDEIGAKKNDWFFDDNAFSDFR